MKHLDKGDFIIPFNNNEKLEKVFNKLIKNPRLEALWVCSNITAIDRFKSTDHGPKHVEIVFKNAIQILRMLHEANVKTSIEKDFKENTNIPRYNLDYKDSEVIVLLGSLLHDVGMSIHPDEHSRISATIAYKILEDVLEGIYPEPEKTIIISETIHGIETHSSTRREIIKNSNKIIMHLPLTVEASVVIAGDALDISQGRAKIPARIGKDDMHSQSALAIKKVELFKPESKPIGIHITMSSPEGLFQVQRILKEKIKRTVIKELFEVSYHIEGSDKKKILNLEE